MSLTKLTTDLENIQALSDTPNSTEGLTADELKALFDKAGTDIKTYINDTLTTEVDSKIEDGIEALDADKAPKASPTFTGTVTLPSSTSIGNVSSTELGYIDGVTSSIQNQLNVKVQVYGASSFDCNTIKDTSFRGAYSCTNGPTNSIGVLQTMFYSVDWVVQVYWGIEGDEMFTRRWTGGTTWSAWSKKW